MAKPFFRQRLKHHFGTDPATLPTLTERFPTYEHANVHLAVEAELAQPGSSHEIMGATSPEYSDINLSILATSRRAEDAPVEGPVEYVNANLDDRSLACVQYGLYLARRGPDPLAIVLCGPNPD